MTNEQQKQIYNNIVLTIFLAFMNEGLLINIFLIIDFDVLVLCEIYWNMLILFRLLPFWYK